MATVLRPLTLGELLDRTFFLYRNHFMLFVGIVALPNMAFLAMQLATAVKPESTGGIAANAVWMLLTLIVYVLALAASTGATVVAVSRVHLDQSISVSSAYAAIKKRIPGLLWIMIGLWIGVSIGFILLIIPGIILALMWALTIPVAVIESKGLNDASSRSAKLTKGSRGRIFVFFFLYMVLLYALMFAFQLPLIALVGYQAGSDPEAVPGYFVVAMAVGQFITSTLVSPVLTIGLSLIYYDERVRKEAFDLELMMKSLENTTGAAAVSSAI